MDNNDPRQAGIGGLTGLKGLNQLSTQDKISVLEMIPSNSIENSLQFVGGFSPTGDLSIPQNREYGKSRFDKEFADWNEYIDYNEIRAQTQSSIGKISNGIVKMAVTAGTTFADNLVGSVAGLVNMLSKGEYGDGQGLYNFINNPVSVALNNVNKALDEAMPTYMTELYQRNSEEGKWWRNMGSSVFWADQIKNSGFMIGMAASAMISSPAIAKGLGTASARQIMKNAVKSAADPKALKTALNQAGSLDDVANVLHMGAKKLKRDNLINKSLTGLIAANGEARLEAIQTADDIDNKNRTAIEQYTQQQIENLPNEIYKEHPEYFNKVTMDGNEYIVPNEQGKAEVDIRTQALNSKRDKALVALANDIKTASNTVFGLNMITLYASDMLALGQAIGTGFKFKQTAERLLRRESDAEILKRGGQELLDATLAKEAAGGIAKVTARKFVHDKTKPALKIARGLLSPVREGTEEMLQGVYSSGVSFKTASDINEFYNYKVNEEGAERSVGIMNALAEGFKETYGTSAGWEQFFSGALIGILPIPFVNMHFSRAEGKDGTKGKLKVNFTNEAWASFGEAKDLRMRAKNMEEYLNGVIADKKYTTLLEGLTAADILSEEEQSAMSDQDKFEAITAKNKQFINMVNMFDKLGYKQEVRDLLEEIADSKNLTGADRESFARDLIEQTSINGVSPLQGKSTDEIIDYVSSNAAANLEKLDEYSQIAEDMQGLFGSIENYDRGESFIENMTWITANIKDLERRFGDLTEKLRTSITDNYLDHIWRKASAISDQDEYDKAIESYNKLESILNNSTDPTEILNAYSSKEVQDAIENDLQNMANAKNLVDIQKLQKDTIDLLKIHALRNQYVANFEQLAGNPSLYYMANAVKDKTLITNAKVKEAAALASALSTYTTFGQFKDGLDQIQNDSTKNMVKQMLDQSQIAKDFDKINNLQNKVNDALDASNSPYADIAKAIFNAQVLNATSYQDASSMDLVKPDDMDDDTFMAVKELLLPIISDHQDKTAGANDVNLGNLDPENSGLIFDQGSNPATPPSTPPDDSSNPPAPVPPSPDSDSHEPPSPPTPEPPAPNPPAPAPEPGSSGETFNDDSEDTPPLPNPTKNPTSPVTQDNESDETKHDDPSDKASEDNIDNTQQANNVKADKPTDPNGYHTQVIKTVETKPEDKFGSTIVEAHPEWTYAKIEYDFLNQVGAFDFVDNINLHKGLEVKFAICKRLNEDINCPHKLLAYVEIDGQKYIIGSIAANRCKELYEIIKSDENKTVEHKGYQIHFSDKISYPITRISTGIVILDNELHPLKEALPKTGDDVIDRPLIGYVTKSGTIITNKGAIPTLSTVLLDKDRQLKSGSVKILIPTGKYDKSKGHEDQQQGAYIPIGLIVGKFDKYYYNSHSDNTFCKTFDSIIDSLARVETVENLNNLMFDLKTLITFTYTGSESFFISAMNNGTEVLDGNIDLSSTYLHIRIGNKDAYTNINITKEELNRDGTRNIDKIKERIKDAIFFANPKVNVSYDRLTDPDSTEYVEMLIDSDLLSVNIASGNAKVKGVEWYANVTEQKDSSNHTTNTTEASTSIPNTSNSVSPNTNALIDDDYFLREQLEPSNNYIDIKHEIDVIKKFLPQISDNDAIRIHNTLINANGKLAGGLFKNGIITLSRMAESGTAYHEAFHYLMHAIMTENEYKSVILDASNVYGINDARELEERLAEDFRQYVEDMESKGQTSLIRRLGSKIIEFFKQMFALKKTVGPNMNGLFKSIYSGKYAGRTINNTNYVVNKDVIVNVEPSDDRISVLQKGLITNPILKQLHDGNMLNQLIQDLAIDSYHNQEYIALFQRSLQKALKTKHLIVETERNQYNPNEVRITDISINGIRLVDKNFRDIVSRAQQQNADITKSWQSIVEDKQSNSPFDSIVKQSMEYCG